MKFKGAKNKCRLFKLVYNLEVFFGLKPFLIWIVFNKKITGKMIFTPVYRQQLRDYGN